MNDILDKRLLCQQFAGESALNLDTFREIAAGYAIAESAIAVLRDLRLHRSYIFYGGFGETLSIGKRGTYTEIDSIWENEILGRITPNDMNKKQLDELQFFDFVRRNGRGDNYFMANTISMRNGDGGEVTVLHRIFYFHEASAVRYALCLYTPTAEMRSSVIVDSLSGEIVPLEQIEEGAILSDREKEVLRLIDKGLSSKEISAALYISIHTVSRHRQNILEKLHAKNSSHACNVAKSLRLM